MDESRKYVRFHCEHPMWIRPYKSSDDAFQLAEVQNISAGGAYFISHGPLKVDQILELSLEVPEKFQMLTLRGPIKHVHQDGGVTHCGLEFEEIYDMKPQSFCNYINHMFSTRAEA